MMLGRPTTDRLGSELRNLFSPDRKKQGGEQRKEKTCFWTSVKRNVLLSSAATEQDIFPFFSYSLLLAAMGTPFPASGQASESVSPTGEIMSLSVA